MAEQRTNYDARETPGVAAYRRRRARRLRRKKGGLLSRLSQGLTGKGGDERPNVKASREGRALTDMGRYNMEQDITRQETMFKNNPAAGKRKQRKRKIESGEAQFEVR